MEINDLDYEKRPFNANKLYEIHSLSSNGFTQYMNHDSYTHKFLEKQAPKIIKNRQQQDETIFNSTAKQNFFSSKKLSNDNEADAMYRDQNNETSFENNQGNDKNNEVYEDLKYRENEKIFNNEQQEENNKNKKIDNDFNLPIQAKTLNNFYVNHSKENNFYNFSKNTADNNNNNNNISNNNVMLLKSKHSVIANNLRSNKNNINKLTANILGSEYSNGYNNQIRTTKSVQKIPSEKDFSISTQKSFYFQKSNLDPLTRRLNITSSNFSKTVNTDSDTTSNSRFDKNYLKNLNLFINSKSYNNMDKIIDADFYSKKPYDGFQSYNVPHVDKLTKSNLLLNNKEKNPMILLTEKIAKSCIGSKSISLDLTHATNNITGVQEENEKLKKIFMIQISSDFLKKSKLPEIQYCVSQPKLKIKRNDLIGGKIKHIGGRYNPYNFQAGRDCETNRRNQVGALFQH